MGAAKRRRRRISCVQDVIDDLDGHTSYMVRNKSGAYLWRQSNALIQKYDREVHAALTQRWILNETCRPLNPTNVKLKDNVVILPEGHREDSNDFPRLFRDYIIEVHGTDGFFRARDDFLHKLMEPNLQLIGFANLYYHPFFLCVGDLCVFPKSVLENSKFMKVLYGEQFTMWDIAYSDWEGKMYERDIDLIQTCMVDVLALRVYIAGTYTDDSANEARLVGNIIEHINDWKFKQDGEIFTKEEIARIIYELFRDISYKLFDFCQSCEISLDFSKQLQFQVSDSAYEVLHSPV